jgi:hypothetical protein
VSAINQQNKETVWGLWQRLNHVSTEDIAATLQSAAQPDIA